MSATSRMVTAAVREVAEGNEEVGCQTVLDEEAGVVEEVVD